MQTFKLSMNLSKCNQTPWSSSRMNSLLWQGIFVTSEIWETNLLFRHSQTVLGLLPFLALWEARFQEVPQLISQNT